MKGLLIIVYIPDQFYESEEIIKYSMLQWILFLMHLLMRSCMIMIYVYKSLSLYNGFLETFYTNNQTILHFINLWLK